MIPPTPPTLDGSTMITASLRMSLADFERLINLVEANQRFIDRLIMQAPAKQIARPGEEIKALQATMNRLTETLHIARFNALGVTKYEPSSQD